MSLDEDAWLSEHLGKPVYRHTGEPPGALPTGLTYTKLPTADSAALKRMQSFGFNLVDTALSFECPLPLSSCYGGAATARMAGPSDEEAVARIAREAFVSDRFHSDPYIPKDAADRIKEAWTRAYFTGKRGEWMVVAVVDGEIAGFLLLLQSHGKLVIDLIAVSKKHRGTGAGRAMIAFAAGSLPQFETMLVGTQATNVASVRLYESIGFRFVGSQYVLHCHR